MNDLRYLAVRILEFDEEERKEFLNILKSQAYEWHERALEEMNWSGKVIDMVNIITEEDYKRTKSGNSERKRK